MRATNIDDVWKHNLFASSLGSILNLRSRDFHSIYQPIIHGIVSAWEQFYFKFTAKNENFIHSYIFDNPVFGTAHIPRINKQFFGAEFFTLHKTRIHMLKFSDISDGLRIRTLDSITLHTGIPFQVRHHLSLRGIVDKTIRALVKNEAIKKTALSIDTFMNRKIKGSKRYRRILTGTPILQITHNQICGKHRDNYRDNRLGNTQSTMGSQLP